MVGIDCRLRVILVWRDSAWCSFCPLDGLLIRASLRRIENLELWAKPQVPGQRVEDLISWVFDNYNKELRAKIEIQDLVRSVIARVQSGEAL